LVENGEEGDKKTLLLAVDATQKIACTARRETSTAASAG